MQIVGVETTEDDGPIVHTIDVWYSERRQAWIVERLDASGRQIGLGHICSDEADASACLVEWLRAHAETHLVAPHQATAAERRLLVRSPARRAA